MDARPFGFTRTVPVSAPFKWNQFGFAVAGPVQIPKVFNGKDGLFFMSNYEGFRLRNQTQVVYSTPPAAMRTGDFSQVLPGTVIKDPRNNFLPFPGNIIPSQRFSSAAVGLLEFSVEKPIWASSLEIRRLNAFMDHAGRPSLPPGSPFRCFYGPLQFC